MGAWFSRRKLGSPGVSAAAPGFDGKSAEDLSKAFSEAMADAQAKSLAAMNEKMQALYASVGLGGAGM